MSALLYQMKADAPSALWPLLDPVGSTTMVDISGNGRHLTNSTSAPCAQTEVVPGAGLVWNPTNGSAHYFQRTYEAWMSPGAGDWLVTFFYRGSDYNATADAFETIYSMDLGDSGNGTIIYICRGSGGTYPRGTVRVWYAGSVIQCSISSQGNVNLLDGMSHQVWVEKRSGTVYVYVDGTLAGSGVRGTPTSMSGTLWVGIAASGSVDYRQWNSTGFIGVWSGVTIPDLARRSVYQNLARRAGVSF